MKFLVLYLALLTFSLEAQNHFYELKAEIPHRYEYNTDSMYKNLIGKKDSELSKVSYKDYAASLTFYHQKMLASGYIYFNWNEAEDYLDALVKKILKAIQTDKKFKVFIVRDEDINASAQDNGIIYIYVGLLAEIKDEAALISVLSHEISHVLNSDTRKNFIVRQRTKRRKIRDLISMTDVNRKFETRADSVGFATASALDYDLTSSYHTFVKFESEYIWYKSQYDYEDPKWHIALDNTNAKTLIHADSLEKLLSDHPENDRRIAALQKFIKNKNGKKRFSANEDFFKDIKYKARMEQLYIDFSEASYKNCLRNAFYYHLNDQADKNYLYYITECLRRMMLVNPELKKQGFLTDDSKSKVFEKNKGILQDVKFLSIDTVFCQTIQKDPVYGQAEKPFETYQQAYNFFYKKSQENNVSDILLTGGLFELSRNKKDKAFEILKKYNGNGHPKNSDFVNAVLSGSVLTQLKDNSNDMVYIEPPDYYLPEKDALKYDYFKSAEIAGQIPEIFGKFKPSANHPVKFLIADSLNIIDYNLYDDLISQLEFFKPVKEAEFDRNTAGSMRDDSYWAALEISDPLNVELLKRNKNFFYFNPDYWSLFKEKGIHSLTRIKPYFYRPKGRRAYFFFEISYFDPTGRNYLYFEQEYLERFTKAKVKKVFKRFYKKLAS